MPSSADDTQTTRQFKMIRRTCNQGVLCNMPASRAELLVSRAELLVSRVELLVSRAKLLVSRTELLVYGAMPNVC